MSDIGVYIGRRRLREFLEESTDDPDWFIVNPVPAPPERASVRRLFVASEGRWAGYFDVSKVVHEEGEGRIYFPNARTGSWHPIPGENRVRFRGFTWKVPSLK